jgi:ATP-dependent DNA helicase RecQ
MSESGKILKQYWGFDAFRPMQEDVINSILNGNDSVALMPTGGGKSLCYQVPGLAKEGLCLVISPLIALMKDQVENLRKKNITAFSIYAGMSRKEVINILTIASNSNCKFLYVSPERLETKLFKEYLPGLLINLIAVDEAHCISQWGYDFRPPYLRISSLRDELPDVPIIALTASATPDVLKDICDKLSNKQPNSFKIFRQSFERPNLSYSVFKVDSKINKIFEILRKVSGSAIIYCKSRKRTKEISELLQMQNISADFYHAGLTHDERNKKQEAWINNKTRVIVCTNAFGMGIDKPDVRIVIHADIPDCLENYYQEAGRAGRDSKKSYAVLLHDDWDINELKGMAALRFPSLEDIRKIYQAVANYLQMPTGSGEGQYYDFDMGDFIKKFNLSTHTSLYALKTLEQDGWLAFNEQVFLPSSVMFITNKKYLYEFESSHPDLEPMMKALLRSYEGIFDFPASISEKTIAFVLKIDVEEVKKQLLQLHQAGIIEYLPQKDTPQLLLLRNRIKAEDISIDMTAYQKRKEQFLQRVAKMISYIKEESICRSQVIGSYFGDDKIKACGICDACQKQKAKAIAKQEFDTLHLRIVNIIKDEPIQSQDLILRLNNIKKEKAWQVIEYLQAENIIDMNSEGWIKLK